MNLFYERLPLRAKPRSAPLSSKILKRAGIGEDYWDVTLDQIPDLPQTVPYKSFLRGYCNLIHEMEPLGAGLVLTGPFGSGKTAIGNIVLMEALKRRARCYHIRAPRLISRMWEKNAELPNGAPLYVGLTSVNFLFIDDFEVFEKDGKVSTERDRAIEQVIRERQERRLPTIIATNHSWERLFQLDYLKTMLEDRYYPLRIDGVKWREPQRRASNR